MRLAIPFALVLLAGCATQPPIELPVKNQEADVAVAVHCPTADKLGPEPDYPDTAEALTAAMKHPDAQARLKANPADVQALTDVLEDIANRLRLVLEGRLMRIQRDREKQAALDGCAKGA